ncbi:hypothetical protein Droror1_Dr00005799 [Drosera rotundifolia]
MKMATYRGSLPRFPWLMLSFDGKDPNNITTQIYSLPSPKGLASQRPPKSTPSQETHYSSWYEIHLRYDKYALVFLPRMAAVASYFRERPIGRARFFRSIIVFCSRLSCQCYSMPV